MTNVVFTDIPLNEAVLSETSEYSFVLKPSGNKGIGVFCTHGIAKGTLLLLFHGAGRIVQKRKLKGQKHAFCQFFGVELGDGNFSVPENFGQMSVGWYLNHSDRPNAHHDEEWEYYASEDICAGTEITINYKDLDCP